MSLPLVFRPAAQTEFGEAAAWYERQRPGLGDVFVAAVQHLLDTIADHPERYAVVDGDMREALVPLFRTASTTASNLIGW